MTCEGVHVSGTHTHLHFTRSLLFSIGNRLACYLHDQRKQKARTRPRTMGFEFPEYRRESVTWDRFLQPLIPFFGHDSLESDETIQWFWGSTETYVWDRVKSTKHRADIWTNYIPGVMVSVSVTANDKTLPIIWRIMACPLQKYWHP